jgi:UDP-2,3-diacylglucosamine hydrolase
MNHHDQPTVIFVADSHFHLDPDAAEQARLDKFLSLLQVARRADHLVRLGDMFDFWFDYPHFRLKGYDTLLNALDEVREAGTRIHFIGGNHDIWAARYLHQRYGSSPTGDTEIVEFGHRRVLLSHGDGLLKFDWAYNSFRAVVRTRAGIVLAKTLHPEILYALSAWLSGKSRGANRDEASRLELLAEKWLRRQTAPDWDLMVTGHVHHPFVTEHEGRRLVLLAGWFDPLGYGLLKDGEFRLMEWGDEPAPDL